jgi:hypothetical protein
MSKEDRMNMRGVFEGVIDEDEAKATWGSEEEYFAGMALFRTQLQAARNGMKRIEQVEEVKEPLDAQMTTVPIPVASARKCGDA